MRYTTPQIYFGCRIAPPHSRTKILAKCRIDKEWYIHFMFDGKFIKKKSGINRFHTKGERYNEAHAVRNKMEEALKEGYNPITDTYEHSSSVSFTEAVRFAIEKKRKDLSHKSFIDLNTGNNLIINKADELGFGKMPVDEIRRKHILHIMESLQSERGFGSVRYNELLSRLSTLYNVMIEWEKAETNPITGIKRQPEPRPEAFKPLTRGEKARIYPHLATNHPAFFTLYLCIYHAGMRPKEVLNMKARDILFSESRIRIEKGKTFRVIGERYAPITPELAEWLTRHVEGVHPDWFVFGKNWMPERRESPLHRNRASEYWKRHVKDELGIDKDMYGAKHTGTDDRLDAGIDMDTIRAGLGHTSKQMTEKYARNKDQILQGKLIKDAPKFYEQDGK